MGRVTLKESKKRHRGQRVYRRPGTGSDRIFYNRPSLAPGDEVTLTDSLGQTYAYRVNEILEVDPTDLGVKAPVGRDVVSLQTCTEDFGDHWADAPGCNTNYITCADRAT